MVHSSNTRIRTKHPQRRELDVAEWGMDPTFWSCIKVWGCELLPPRLTPSVSIAGGFMNGQGNPVHTVELCGAVVMVARRPQMVVYAVDDGTAVLDVIVWREKVGSPCGLCCVVGSGVTRT